MHRLSSKTLCPARLLRFLASTARTSRRRWKRCRPPATRRMESSVLSVPTMPWTRTGTAGGRSAPGRLVRSPSRRCASHDAGQGRRRGGNLRLGSLAIALCHPDGVPERVMREALDWLVDRLASGWATHAVLPADEGKQQTSSSWLLAPAWNTPSRSRTVAVRQGSPTRRPGNRTGVHRSPLGGTAAARVEGWAEPVGATTLACAAPQLRRTRAASSPRASAC